MRRQSNPTGYEPLNAESLSTVADPAQHRCHHCGATLGPGTCSVSVSGREIRVCGDACRTAGVSGVTVDFPLRRAEVRFERETTRLHTLLETLAGAGYRAAPYTPHAEEAAIESERRTRIRGLGISALFGMQVMLLSIALYASDHYGGMDPGFENLFRWLAMMLTVPVLAWPGRTFFTGAAAALRGRRLTMDVPVALGLSLAFIGSAFATITGEGEIWFDSVVMFVTLLSGARYLELVARRRATAEIRALARSAPLVATRIQAGGSGRRTECESGNGAWSRAEVRDGSGTEQAAGITSEGDGGNESGCCAAGEGAAAADERVPAATLRGGDRVRVRPGEAVPADAVIRFGRSTFDESLLTGESNPVARSAGDPVLAGSVNGSGVVEVEVTRCADATVLGGVLRRAEQAARKRPAIAELADRAAAWFVGGVLVLAAGVAVGWLLHDSARVIPVLVSVLVVTCPCALSLATPAAMTAALGALARAGLIVTGANAVERLALATHCLADKTGTLTEGRFRLRSVSALTDVSESRCLALAAALERYATHPAASAIVATADGRNATDAQSSVPEIDSRSVDSASGTGNFGYRAAGHEASTRGQDTTNAARQYSHPAFEVGDARAHTGGVAGRIGGALHAVGSLQFVAGACGLAVGDDSDPGLQGEEEDGTRVYLAREGRLLARFILADALRAGARGVIEGLRARGIETTIASGDSAATVERAAAALGVTHHLCGLSPEDKLDEAARLAARGERVLMLGDGVNDAPALAGAYVSVAMGRGAAAAAARADAVVIGDQTVPRRVGEHQHDHAHEHRGRGDRKHQPYQRLPVPGDGTGRAHGHRRRPETGLETCAVESRVAPRAGPHATWLAVRLPIPRGTRSAERVSLTKFTLRPPGRESALPRSHGCPRRQSPR